MSKKEDREGLSLGYRIMHRIKVAGLTVYGPAQLSDDKDPIARLHRKRAAKVAAARKARLERESDQGG
ncbi:hypothetical protein [Ornithinimicrobium sp. INDO-MA30-4]|uniref:hypothetical protein n=1 Tax=Ornithinimicrobium sp. INDO-MA30-4 TaxID=2908651 RepID=UPI001F2B5C29|nr:hypothetical protein [Ornithinimicrobium sp. INDO-MA30-4]UJH69650.1 hypothetical protein L0A91_09915 [Ornithinimicrobium sp. INDO-MA30-4]